MDKTTSNPFDHLLVRTPSTLPGDTLVKQLKTLTVHEQGGDRIKILIANPAPNRFFPGVEIAIPEYGINTYEPCQRMAQVGFAVSEQNAILYALGRFLANFDRHLPPEIRRHVRQAIFSHRQRPLF